MYKCVSVSDRVVKVSLLKTGSTGTTRHDFRRHQGKHRERRIDAGQQQGQEDAEAADDILVVANPAAGAEVPEDPVPRFARKGRVGQHLGTHSDAGRMMIMTKK